MPLPESALLKMIEELPHLHRGDESVALFKEDVLRVIQEYFGALEKVPKEVFIVTDGQYNTPTAVFSSGPSADDFAQKIKGGLFKFVIDAELKKGDKK